MTRSVSCRHAPADHASFSALPTTANMWLNPAAVTTSVITSVRELGLKLMAREGRGW